MEQDLTPAGQRELAGAAEGDRAEEAGRLGIDHLHGIGQIVGDEKRPVIGREGELGGPSAQGHAAIAAIAAQQFHGNQVARAVDSPGQAAAIGTEDHHFMRSPQADREELVVPADGHAVGVGRGLAAGVEREGGERGLGGVQIDAGQALAQNPAQVNIIGGRRKPPVFHVGDVAALAVATDRDLPQVVAFNRNGAEYPERLGGDDRDFLRSRVADQQDRTVRREGEPTRLSAHGHAGGDAQRLEIDLCHLVGGAHGHEGRPAPLVEHDPARFGTNLDAAGDGHPVVIDLEQGEIVAEPVRDHSPRAVARNGHPGGLIAGCQLMENLAARGIDQRYRAGGLVGHKQSSAVGAQGQRDRRTVRLILRGWRGRCDLGAVEPDPERGNRRGDDDGAQKTQCHGHAATLVLH
jgi:hypothetical protein